MKLNYFSLWVSRKRPALVTTTFWYFEVVVYESFDCIWNLNWYLFRSDGCFNSYVTMHAARKWKPLTTEWLPRLFPGQGGEGPRISSISPAYRGTKMEWVWIERPCITPLISDGFKWLVYNSCGKSYRCVDTVYCWRNCFTICAISIRT